MSPSPVGALPSFCCPVRHVIGALAQLLSRSGLPFAGLLPAPREMLRGSDFRGPRGGPGRARVPTSVGVVPCGPGLRPETGHLDFSPLGVGGRRDTHFPGCPGAGEDDTKPAIGCIPAWSALWCVPRAPFQAQMCLLICDSSVCSLPDTGLANECGAIAPGETQGSGPTASRPGVFLGA